MLIVAVIRFLTVFASTQPALNVAMIAGDGIIVIVSGHDLSNKLVTHHIIGSQMNKCDVSDALQNPLNSGQTRSSV